MDSILNREVATRLDLALENIKKQYLSQDKNIPWLIGYSGGKDSTCTSQLVFQALIQLKKNNIPLKRKVYIFSSDTMIENPLVKDIIIGNISLINRKSKELLLPVEALLLKPQTDRTFWVNVIGRGYPTPNTMFRWCTDRLKIEPANTFIKNCIDKNGEVIMVLGVREGESNTRDRVLKNHSIIGEQLMKHTTLTNAYIFAPIRHLTLKDIFTYLAAFDSPWGSDNKQLYAFYEESVGEDCPMFISESDKTTSNSCGNSRMGCWVCTVVSKDKSLTGFINTGYYDFLKPLLDFRNWIVTIRDDENYRCHHRTNGSIYTKPIHVDKDNEGFFLLIPKKGAREKIKIRLGENGEIAGDGLGKFILLEKDDLSNHLKKNNLTFGSPELARVILKDRITGEYLRLGTGPFNDHAKKIIFEKLIETEFKLSNLLNKEYQLITDGEIMEIKKLWSKAAIDTLFIDQIMNKFRRGNVDLLLDSFEEINKKYEDRMKLILNKHNLDYEIVNKLVFAEKDNIGKDNKNSIQDFMASIFNSDKVNF